MEKNFISAQGYITRNAVVVNNKNGKGTTAFSTLCLRGKEPDQTGKKPKVYIDLLAFGEKGWTAENFPLMKDGTLVSIEGEPVVVADKDKDGNKVAKLQIKVHKIYELKTQNKEEKKD